MDEGFEDFERAGADLIFPKPVRMDKVEALIEYSKKYGVQSRSNVSRIFDKVLVEYTSRKYDINSIW